MLARPPIFLVADGMGGHTAGEVASGLVVEEFTELAGLTTLTSQQIHAALGRVSQRLRNRVAGRGIAGTTVAGVAVASLGERPYWLVFNIGDSRVYRFADHELHQVSVDHSVVQELVDAGRLDPAEAPRHPERHVITRALGTGPVPEADYWLLPARPADRMLVCSDGLVNELDEDTLSSALDRFAEAQDAAQWLVDAAVEVGGRDNVTVVVVDADAPIGSPDDTTPRGAAGDPDGRNPTDHWQDEIFGTTVPQWLKVGRP